MTEWKLADAKNRFSELVDLALGEGPQRISRRKDTVVVLSLADYEKLVKKAPTLKDFLLRGPSLEGLDLQRDQTPARDVRL
jgi:antitoxin Phd